MDRAQRDELIRLITSPPAGSRIAAAKDFGIDLTLLVRTLELTPTERLQKLAEPQAFVQELQTAMKAEGRKQNAESGDPGHRNGFEQIFKILCGAEVRFVMVGDLALAAYGRFPAALLLELCYDGGGDNIERLAKALAPFHPRLRGVQSGTGTLACAEGWCLAPTGTGKSACATIASGMNFTLTTDIGEIDLFGEVTGIGGYKDVKALSISLVLFGFRYAVLSFEGLVRCKRATARPKDLLSLPEIEALLEMETQLTRQSGPAEAQNQGRIEEKQSEI